MTTPTTTTTASRELAAAISRVAAREPDRPAIVDPTAVTSYHTLLQQADAYVTEHQPQVGALQLIAATPFASTFAAALGVWMAGGIPVPHPAGLDRPALTKLTLNVTAVAHRHHTCDPWRGHLHTVNGSHRLTLIGGEPPTRTRVSDALGLRPSGTVLLAAPLHAGALFETAVRQLAIGGTVMLQVPFHPGYWHRAATDARVDVAVLTTAQAHMLAGNAGPGWLHIATSSLRQILVPATAPPTDLTPVASIAPDSCTVTAWYHAPGYDGAITAAAPWQLLAPLPGSRLRVVDITGRALPAGATGLIEGASTAGVTAHRATAACIPAASWRTTGDIGLLDPAGHLRLVSLTPGTHFTDTAGRHVPIRFVRTGLLQHSAIASCEIHVLPGPSGIARARILIGATREVDPATIAAYSAAALQTRLDPAQIAITTHPASATDAAAGEHTAPPADGTP